MGWERYKARAERLGLHVLKIEPRWPDFDGETYIDNHQIMAGQPHKPRTYNRSELAILAGRDYYALVDEAEQIIYRGGHPLPVFLPLTVTTFLAITRSSEELAWLDCPQDLAVDEWDFHDVVNLVEGVRYGNPS